MYDVGFTIFTGWICIAWVVGWGRWITGHLESDGPARFIIEPALWPLLLVWWLVARAPFPAEVAHGE